MYNVLIRAAYYHISEIEDFIGLISWYYWSFYLTYRIYSAIRRGFHLSRMTTNNSISSM